MTLRFFSQIASLLFLTILLSGVEAQNDSTNSVDPLNNVCEYFDVYAETYVIITRDNETVHRPLNGSIEFSLYRLCNSSRTIDFSIPVQMLILCKDHDSEFYKRHGGDRFMASVPQFNASAFGPATISNFLNASDEELDRNHCYLMKVTLDSHLLVKPSSPFQDNSYVDADIAHIDSEEVRGQIRLTPGHIAGLEPGVMSQQKMTFLHSNFTEIRKVTVMASWFNIREDVEGLHAVIDRKYMKQYITIFYEQPDRKDTRLFPGHVNATLIDSPNSQTHYHGEQVRLYPGWIGELSPRGSNQTLIRFRDTYPISETEVTVYPKYRQLSDDEGLHATYDLIYARTVITIYYKN